MQQSPPGPFAWISFTMLDDPRPRKAPKKIRRFSSFPPPMKRPVREEFIENPLLDLESYPPDKWDDL